MIAIRAPRGRLWNPVAVLALVVPVSLVLWRALLEAFTLVAAALSGAL